MKKSSNKVVILKRIFILTIVFCMLSNYFSIVMDLSVSIATEKLQLDAEATSKIDNVHQNSILENGKEIDYIEESSNEN